MENNLIFKLINESIDETLGISNQVLIESNNILNTILKYTQEQINNLSDSVNITNISNYFNHNFNNTTIRVIFNCKYFKNNNIYKSFISNTNNYSLEDCSSNYSVKLKSEININFYSIGNKINKESLSTDIYHELNHILEQQSMKKRYALYKNNNFILNNIHNKNKIYYYIAWILYLNDKSEQSAFSSSVINTLLNHNPSFPKTNEEIKNIIKTTTIFKQLKILITAKKYILTNKTKFSIIKNEINITPDKLLKLCEEDINKIKYKIGRTITFYKDYLLTHYNSRITPTIKQFNESKHWFYHI